MKKLFITFITLIVTFCCIFFTGCSKKNVYNFTKLTYEDDETKITLGIGDKYDGITLTEDFATILFEDDVIVIRINYTTTYNEKEYEHNYAYIAKFIEGINNEIYLYSEFDDEALILVKNNDTISMEYNDVTFIFNK